MPSEQEPVVAGVTWGAFSDQPARHPAPGIAMHPLSGERVMLCWVILDPDAVLPVHSHPHEQGGVIIEGLLELTVAGDTRRLALGDGFVIRGGVEHSAVAGPDGARTLDVFSPPREDFRS